MSFQGALLQCYSILLCSAAIKKTARNLLYGNSCITVIFESYLSPCRYVTSGLRWKSWPVYDGVHAQTIFTRWLRIDNNKHGYKNVFVSDTYFSIKTRFNVLNASVDICTELIRCFVGER